MELLERIDADKNSILLPECIYQDEGWSGSILERPDLDRLRTDAREHKFEVLYAYDKGRLSRIFLHQELVLEELKKYGVEFISLHDINGETSEAILAGRVMGLFHEYDRLKISERMRIGKIRKAKEARLIGYPPKYGYIYHPRIKTGQNAREGYFEVNKEQAEVVRNIYKWFAAGKSKYWVRDELYRRGIKPAKMKRDVWSLSVLDRMVRDSTYCGEHYYNKCRSVETKNPRKIEKYRKTVKGSRIANPKSEWFMIEVPAIVSKELFEKVQTQLARNKRTSTRNNKKHEYLVGGLIDCVCGLARTGEPTNKHLYYRCNDRLIHTKDTRNCDKPGINATVLDSLVWRNIESYLTQPELIAELAQRWQTNSSPLLRERLEAFKAELKHLAEVEERYVRTFGEGLISEQIYRSHIAEIYKKRDSLVIEINQIEKELAQKPIPPLEQLIDGVVKLVKDLDLSKKKQIIQKVVTKVVATKEEVTVWGRIPILTTEQVGLDVKYRYCRAAKCWQVYAV